MCGLGLIVSTNCAKTRVRAGQVRPVARTKRSTTDLPMQLGKDDLAQSLALAHPQTRRKSLHKLLVHRRIQEQSWIVVPAGHAE